MHHRIRVGLSSATKREFHSSKLLGYVCVETGSDVEMNETGSGIIDMLNSINTALQKVSAKPVIPKPHQSATSFQELGGQQRQRITSKLQVGPAFADASFFQTKEKRCLSAFGKTDAFDSITLAVDCPDKEFRSIEASLYQVLHRTTSNEPWRIVPQIKGQKGFEAWHAIVRRYDQRNMSDNKSAYEALISNISERDREKRRGAVR